MEEVSLDYWKCIVRGVVYMLLATLMFTLQTSIVKWGSIIGYTSAVILIFRGIIQFICCFFEATISIQKQTPYNGPRQFRCNISHICKDIKHIGILPKKTMIPMFDDHETSTLTNPTLSDYGSIESFQSNKSYSKLSRPTSPIHDAQLINLNIHNCTSTEIQINSNSIYHSKSASNLTFIQVVERSEGQQQKHKSPISRSKSVCTISPTKQKPTKFRFKMRSERTKSYKCLIWSTIILRGIFGGIGTLLLFQGSMLLPVGDMQALMALTAAITPFLASLFFRDALTRLHLLSLIGAIVGVILIVQPPFLFTDSIVTQNKTAPESEKDVVMGYIYAISGAVMQSLIYICIQFARKVPIYMLTMSQSIMGVITGLIVLLYTKDITEHDIKWINNWFDMAYLIILGCVGYVFLWLLTMSGRYISSGVIALLLNLSIVWGYIIQILVFNEKVTWITMIGAVCMFLSAAIVSLDKISDARKKSMSVIQRNYTTTVGV